MHEQLSTAIAQIEFARSYTLSLLEDIPDEDYFRQPSQGVTHIAWQVGHLAMAEYGLTLFRIRGRADGDSNLMSSKFRKLFSKGTTPDSDASRYPSAEEIREVFKKVHTQAMRELPSFSLEQINAPVDMPYAIHATNFGGLLFCAQHEMLHAGQIGLLRRLLGHSPIR